jgi:hypothetical protein
MQNADPSVWLQSKTLLDDCLPGYSPNDREKQLRAVSVIATAIFLPGSAFGAVLWGKCAAASR